MLTAPPHLKDAADGGATGDGATGGGATDGRVTGGWTGVFTGDKTGGNAGDVGDESGQEPHFHPNVVAQEGTITHFSRHSLSSSRCITEPKVLKKHPGSRLFDASSEQKRSLGATLCASTT